jgi:Zn ribbon nucleic-acid-binding protein
MINYITARCPRCGRWQVTSTKKGLYDAVFRCRFCGAQRKLYIWRKDVGPIPSGNLEWVYCGSDNWLARELLLKAKNRDRRK